MPPSDSYGEIREEGENQPISEKKQTAERGERHL